MSPTRREFLVRATRTLAGGAAAPLLTACASSQRGAVQASPVAADSKAAEAPFAASFDVSALKKAGQSSELPVPGPDGAPILVVRESSGDFVALSLMCTHEGCPVDPPSGGILSCPCHGSRFDLEGRVLHGPAQFPLTRYEAEYDAASGILHIRTG